MKKKVSALFMAALCTFSTFAAACGGPSGGPAEGLENTPSSTKTTITIKNFDGGIGTEWLDEAAERFAKAKKEESYASDKKGVYVDVQRASKIDLAMISKEDGDIYFTERRWEIDQVQSMNNVFLDITDIVKDETRVGGSIESAIYEQKRQSVQGYDGKYYALPHYEFFGGLSYDREAFDTISNDNKTYAYFAADDDSTKVEYVSKYGRANFVSSLDDAKKSVGPDGKKGTQDDGLPASMEELIILMSYFKYKTNFAPVVLSGKYPNYSNYFLAGMWATLAGQQQMQNYYNCSGEIEIVTGYKNGYLFGTNYIKEPIVEKVTLNEANGYLGQHMAAKYYAIAMLEIMYKEGFFSSDSNKDTIDHFGAQKALIYNPINSTYKKAAMLMEASYWYNEATLNGSFDSYKRVSADSEERDLRFMMLPTSVFTQETQVETSNTLMDIGIGVCVVNKNVEKDAETLKATRDFIKFLYSKEELAYFSANTGMTRPLNYTLEESQINALAGYSRYLYQAINNKEANVVYYSGTTDTHRKVKSYIKIALELPREIFVGNNAYNNYYTMLKLNATTQNMFENSQISAGDWSGYIGG